MADKALHILRTFLIIKPQTVKLSGFFYCRVFMFFPEPASRSFQSLDFFAKCSLVIYRPEMGSNRMLDFYLIVNLTVKQDSTIYRETLSSEQ